MASSRSTETRRRGKSSSNSHSGLRMATMAAAAAAAAAATTAAAVLLRAPVVAAAAGSAAVGTGTGAGAGAGCFLRRGLHHSTASAAFIPVVIPSSSSSSFHPRQQQALQQRPPPFLGGVRPLSAHGVAKGRPSLDDVERISKGQAAKKRGVGSRSVCHRLNEMERKEFELAKKLGFVQLRGTGYRRERKGSPLANIHRQLCDALARPCVEIHRGLGTDAIDEVVVDLSPLRPTAAGALDAAFAVLRAVEAEVMPLKAPAAAAEGAVEGEEESGDGVLARWEEVRESFPAEEWETRAIWDLPVLAYVYDCTGDRALAKKVAQEAHARLGAVLGGKGKSGKR